MKSSILALALVGFALTACEDYGYDEAPSAQPVRVEVAPAAEDLAVDAAETVVEEPQPPIDAATLPPEERSSEETVAPESETLFY